MIRKFPQCVNYLGTKNQTPLHCAADNGHLDVAQTILSDGADSELDVNAM